MSSKRGAEDLTQAESSGYTRTKTRRLDISNDESDQENTEQSIIENSVLASQAPEKDQDPPLPGVIKRVSLVNFMCHKRLDVNLGSHVNFIIGRNGSGKSAIITALVVGLGGKATTTNRGSAVKNFIKVGKKSAAVEITLYNKGQDAYKHDLYGDKIVIKRRFTADGGSSYSVPTASGEPILHPRDEIRRITEHFNIQVDNPVSILNQDTSRNFLNTKSAGDKFKFFMKATQLERMSSDYDEVRRHKEQTRVNIDSKEQTLEAMSKEVKIWEHKYRNLAAIHDLKIKIKHLKNEMAWAMVAEREKELKPLQKALATEEAAFPRFTKKVDESKEQVKVCEDRYKNLEQDVIGCSREVENLEPLLQQKRKELQQAKQKITPLQHQLKTCDRELRSTRREKQQCEDRIEELKSAASHDYEDERRKREEQISQLEGKRNDLKSKQRVSEHELEQYRGAVAKIKTEMAQIESVIKSKQLALRESRVACQTLQAAKNDRLKRYGKWMPEVMRLIQSNKGKFHRMPVGPLGVCFELTDYKWALAVEVCLQGLISSFVCHDRHDEQMLETILSKACPNEQRPSIITCAFSDRKHDVSKNRANTKRFLCLLDAIVTDNPVVSNILIDQRSIENILLVENDEEARNFMMSNPPQTVKESFGLTGERSLCRPTYRVYSVDKTIAKYLMADVTEQVALLQREQVNLEKEIGQLQGQKDELNQEMRKNLQGERSSQTSLDSVIKKINHLSFDIEELQSVEDPEPVDVTTLEEEVQAYNAKIDELQTKRHEILEEKQRADEEREKAEESFAQVEKEIREKSDQGIPLREEINQVQKELETARSNQKYYKDKLKEQEGKIKDLSKQVERFTKEVEEDRGKALQICDPIPTKRTANNIDNEITQIQRRIEEEEREQGNEEEIRETYKSKKETFIRVQRELQQLKNFLERLDEIMQKRQIQYLKMRKTIASTIKYFFIVQLFQRAYSGRMDFDFEKQTLDIFVNTTSQDEKNGKSEVGKKKGRDLKALSGGERSFSTVCFILSLWEAMEAPFRCLDEFDVFMDMVNRRISMDMMMETADMHKNMQFVFLTPQDMSATKKIRNVRIYRMPDPERNQATLNFSQRSPE